MDELLFKTIITPVVIAAVVAQVVTIILTVINNRRLSKIEKYKKSNEIDVYRYTNLYELLKNWGNFTTKSNEENASKDIGTIIENMATISIMHGFFDDANRYEIAKPLLNESYTVPLDEFFKYGRDCWFEVLLITKKRSELKKMLLDVRENPSSYENPDEIEKEIFEKLIPMQNVKNPSEIKFGIDIEREELEEKFYKAVISSTHRLREAIEKQLAELLKETCK